MIKEKKQFVYIIANESVVTIDLALIINSYFPILWNRDGQFGLIPTARIKNTYENWQNQHKFRPQEVVVCDFSWRETEKIPASTAKLFLE